MESIKNYQAVSNKITQNENALERLRGLQVALSEMEFASINETKTKKPARFARYALFALLFVAAHVETAPVQAPVYVGEIRSESKVADSTNLHELSQVAMMTAAVFHE